MTDNKKLEDLGSAPTEDSRTDHLQQDYPPSPGIVFEPGDRVDRYLVEEAAGHGGMATVYKVRHLTLDTYHALKVLFLYENEKHQRLVEEGRTQAKLSHPNLVSVTDLLDIEGSPALISEWIEGLTLSQWMEQELLSIESALDLFEQVVEGVAYAHEHGIIHRDLKPANILLEKSGGKLIAKITDFGIAKNDSAGLHKGLTQSGRFLGTPVYMSPEQMHDAGAVDLKTDIFSLGVILYELLCGRRPFASDNLLGLYQALCKGDYPSPDVFCDNLPESVVRAIKGCLIPDPNARISSCKQLLSVLRDKDRSEFESGETWEEPSGGDGLLSPVESRKTDPALEQPGGTNLDEPTDEFIGRKDEIKTITHHFKSTRLLTLMGQGGAGKTRISLQFALAAEKQYTGGVWFCDLSLASTALGITQIVAATLGIPLDVETPHLQLGKAIAKRGNILLILDNFEQIVSCANETVSQWFKCTDEAHFLVTSRERLGIAGEQTMPLPPLNRSDGVNLFTSRAKERLPDFELQLEDIPTIESIVDTLGGLPLAIELAAARIEIFQPIELHSRLSKRFELLRDPGQSKPDRHTTLRAAIDWSWALLSPVEQFTLAQLTVFGGGFFVDAAEAVVDLSQFQNAPWLPDVLSSLWNKSLIARRHVFGKTRFRLYENIREYGQYRLNEHPHHEVIKVHRAHARWYGQFGTAAYLSSLEKMGGLSRFEILALEMDNLLLAKERSLETEDFDNATRAACAITEILSLHGPFSLAETLIGKLLEYDNLDDSNRTRLLFIQANILTLCNKPEEGLELIASLSTWLHKAKNRSFDARLKRREGVFHYQLRDRNQSMACYKKALDIARADKDRVTIARALQNMGVLYMEQGEMDKASSCYKEALEYIKLMGNRRDEGIIMGDLAIIHRQQGRNTSAMECYQEALDIHQVAGNRKWKGEVLGNLGNLLTTLNKTEEAREAYLSALEIHREVGNKSHEGLDMGNLGDLLLSMGETEEAEHAFNQAIEICDEHWPTASACFRGSLALIYGHKGHLDEAENLMNHAEEALRGVHKYELGKLLCKRGELNLLQKDTEMAQKHLSEAKVVNAEFGENDRSDLSVAIANLQNKLSPS